MNSALASPAATEEVGLAGESLSEATAGAINVEALAAANVDVLVIGLYQPDDDAKKFAEKLFAQFPQWPAS